MQTFLPYPSFAESAKVLDNLRLRNQRKETRQLLDALMGRTIYARNHPACIMWKGHEYLLCQYGITVCFEAITRGTRDNLLPQFESDLQDLPKCQIPSWLGFPEFHDSHRSNLLRKSNYYLQFNWNLPSTLPYYWPSKEFRHVNWNAARETK